MEHIVRLSHVMEMLRSHPLQSVCCFRQMVEDDSWAPIHFQYNEENGLYGQLVAKETWQWRTDQEMEDEYGEEYWLLMPKGEAD